ncbi:hypothetical protein ACU4GH_41200 [Bradyrhizobium betae]
MLDNDNRTLLITHDRAKGLTTTTESSRNSDAPAPGLFDRTTYIMLIRTISGNATSRAAIIAKRLLRTEQALEKRYDHIEDPDRGGADLNGNDIVRIGSLVLRGPGAGNLRIDVPRSRRAEWWRADASRTNGPRASGGAAPVFAPGHLHGEYGRR